jgi:NAD(P)H-flavin reductase
MAIIKKYLTEVISIVHHFGNLYTIVFRTDAGKFKYNPGQFLHLALDTEYDGSGQWPESRCFSMQSSPGEENLKITYSAKGSFTKQMEQQLKPGSKIWLKLPYGNLFTQPHNKTNTVFIAGGTGITPFLSLFTDESFKDYILPRLYIGFRSGGFNIYGEELNKASNLSLFIKIFYEDADGIIDIQHIFGENGQASDYFISGPPSMIKVFKQSLKGYGIPENQILTDEWE